MTYKTANRITESVTKLGAAVARLEKAVKANPQDNEAVPAEITHEIGEIKEIVDQAIGLLSKDVAANG